ncbi:FIP1[V]-like protein [Forsythia ovata]|uniref:FIP1[V]-like protein n=1 Tax=Forsythia ovata TaxID=205694 RepID=A0ABD1UUB4_9LAMI
MLDLRISMEYLSHCLLHLILSRKLCTALPNKRGSKISLKFLPVGRPIPVETGSGDRLPSIDTRRPRMHDSDAIIEIMCQADDDDMAEQQENDPSRKDLRGNDEIDDLPQENTENYDGFSHAYDDIVGDDALHLPSEAPGQYHSSREFGVPREER